jgi:hypothetical protein
MRWKTSIPRTLATRPFGATYVATPLVTMVVGLTKRPDQTVVALQSVVQFLDVWKTPVKFPVASQAGGFLYD